MYELFKVYTIIVAFFTGDFEALKHECDRKYICQSVDERMCVKEELEFRMEKCRWKEKIFVRK